MKSTLFGILFLAVSQFAIAEPKAYSYIWEKRMSESSCLTVVFRFARQKGLGLERIGRTDYLLIEEDDAVGNAYFSQGFCHIYLK